jgi:hypothetical protein
MKRDQKDLDNLFKKGLEDPANKAAYREADWEAMEQMLDKRKKRSGIVYWLPLTGSAAALLLLFLGWLFFRPEIVKEQKKGKLAIMHHPKENTGTSGGASRQAADSSKQKMPTPANYAGKPGTTRHGQKSKSFFTLSAGGARRNTGYPSAGITNRPEGGLTLAANGVGITGEPSFFSDQSLISDYRLLKDTGVNNMVPKKIGPVVKAKSINQPKSGSRPQFALGVIASSDLNGVSSFDQSKVGGNFGLIFSVGLSKKWTISTGVMYSIKPYQTGFENYQTGYKFNNEPSSITANCRMLDIPLNVNYQVYNKQGNKITIGSGLSSYIILREDYRFSYSNSNPYASGPAGYSVINKNRNILGIVNLDATYQHQVNSKMGIVIQPYFKLPLANVGASQVRLQTAGVAVGLNWNLNSSKKP